jgi:hypothetical protein
MTEDDLDARVRRRRRAGTLLAVTGLQGGIKRNSDTPSATRSSRATSSGANEPQWRRGLALVLRNMHIGCDAYACSLRSLTPRMRVCVAGASLFLVSGLRDRNLLDLLAKATIGRATKRMTN